MENVKFCETELLYFGKGNTPSLHLHTHPFYQLEVCVFPDCCIAGMPGRILCWRGGKYG